MKRVIRFLFSGLGTVLTAVLFLLVLYLPDKIGRLEGIIAPVVTQMNIEVEGGKRGFSHITGSFSVERPDCSFHHIEWYLVTPSRQVLAEVNFPEGVKVRSEGYNPFGPWRISMSKKELENRSLAEVFHQCPGRPWLTITRFYP